MGTLSPSARSANSLVATVFLKGDPAALRTEGPVAVELRRVAADGSFDAILPDWSDLTFSQDFDPGTLTFTYALSGRNASLFAHGLEVVTLLDGEEPADGRFFLTQGQGSNLAEQDASATRQYNLPCIRQRFDKLIIAPSLTSTVADPQAFAWTDKTPGDMVITAIDNAMSRASQLITPTTYITPDHPVSWLDATMGFSATTDSAGVPWPDTYDYTPTPGDSVSDLLKWLSDNGFAYSRMQGHTLQLFANLGVNRSTGANPVVLASGKDFTDAAYQTDSTDLVNALMVIGDSTGSPTGSPAIAWVYDTDSIAQFGYREGKLSVSGISTQTMLKAAGNAYLSYMKLVRYSYTYTQSAQYLERATAASGTFRPFIDFSTGDTVLVMDGPSLIPERIRLLSASWPSASAASVALTVNDFFQEKQLEIEQRLSKLGG